MRLSLLLLFILFCLKPDFGQEVIMDKQVSKEMFITKEVRIRIGFLMFIFHLEVSLKLLLTRLM